MRLFSPIGNGVRRSAAAAALAVLAGVSCRGEARPESEQPPTGATKSGVRAPVAGKYSLQDFARLRWLDGSWRGRCRTAAISTSAMGHGARRLPCVASRTRCSRGLPTAPPSGFAGARSPSEGGSRWVATRLDSSAVDFASARDASSNFTWVRESPDRWTATLRSVDKQGRAQTIVYPMERVRR